MGVVSCLSLAQVAARRKSVGQEACGARVPKWVANTASIRHRLQSKALGVSELPVGGIAADGVACTARVQSLLETAHMALGKDFSCDTSQDVHRTPWSKDGVHTITSSSELYWSSTTRGGRAVLSREHFRLLGYPPYVCSGSKRFSTSVCKDLAGECMAPPVVGFIVTCLLHAASLPCMS